MTYTSRMLTELQFSAEAVREKPANDMVMIIIEVHRRARFNTPER